MIRATISMALAGAVMALAAGEAAAQGAGCGDIQQTLVERKGLVDQANQSSSAKRKMTAQGACALFTKLQSNGVVGVKWLETNKEWCSIPDSFLASFKEDHTRVQALRTKVCNAATQQAAMERKMRAQATQNQGGGLLGGPGLSGSYAMPKGAL